MYNSRIDKPNDNFKTSREKAIDAVNSFYQLASHYGISEFNMRLIHNIQWMDCKLNCTGFANPRDRYAVGLELISVPAKNFNIEEFIIGLRSILLNLAPNETRINKFELKRSTDNAKYYVNGKILVTFLV